MKPSLFHHRFPSCFVRRWAAGGLMLAAACAHAGVVELTSRPEVLTSGAYTYFSGQTEGKPGAFTTKFYPDPNSLASSTPANKDGSLESSTSTPGPIPMASGDLTDRALNGSPRNDTSVTGWNGNTSYTGDSTSAFPGYFDIVFDLGAAYDHISRVVINYTDTPGHRFDPTPGAQAVFYSQNAPNAASPDGLTQLASSTAVADAKTGEMTFAAENPARARYLVLRLTMLVSGKGAASTGGYVNSVRIFQDIPDNAP